VGTLRTVILHRPGAGLRRLTRAQQEHDAFIELLRSRGVEMVLL
jgi:arginine deiminase